MLLFSVFRFLLRRRFIASHGILREILGNCLGAEPSGLTFAQGPNGKPGLAGAWRAGDLRFNMSHSEDLACDYPCFWSHAPDEFYYDMANYYISCGIIAGLDYAVNSGYINCPDWPVAPPELVSGTLP